MTNYDRDEFIKWLNFPEPLGVTMSKEPLNLRYKIFYPSLIEEVQFYPPAVKMIFTDGTETVAVTQDGDEYNPEVGMMVCIFKYIFGDKTYNNMFRKWIKHDEDRKKAAASAAAKEKELKVIRDRQIAKREAKKAVRHQNYIEEQIAIQKEAYLQAMAEKESDAIGVTD